MKLQTVTAGFLRWLRQQQLYIAIAVAVYAVFWAILGQRANMPATLIYSLLLCNLTVLVQEKFGFLHEQRPFPSYWLVYLCLLLLTTPLWVVLSTALVYQLPISQPRLPWPEYFRTGWKFPFVATVIFGVGRQIYRATKCRLERSNRELQRAVDLEVAQRELQAQELERAREIQQALLPKHIPQIPGFDIAGAWEPARVVGGDYFDVIRLSPTRVGICIADVVGKSVSAALLMANVQATVRAFASDAVAPAVLCERVNSVLCNNIASGKFVTLFYGVLDSERHTLEYTNAGHLRPILVAGSRTQPLDNGGALLGVFPEWKYEDSVAHLAPGDRLLLFTDGITEAAKPDGEEFGEQRLTEMAARCEQRSASELKDYLLTQVKDFCNSQLADDATLIVMAADGYRDKATAASC